MGFWDGLRSAVRIVGGAVAVVAGAVTGQPWLVALGASLLSAEASSQAMRTARNKARDAYNDSLQDRKQMVRSATAERRIIYGRSRVSGPILYVQSTGAKKEYLHLVVALAGHECDAIEEVWLGDTKLPDPDASGNILTGAYAKGTKGTATEYTTSGSSITLSRIPTSVKSVARIGRGALPLTYSWTPGTAVVTFTDGTSTQKAIVYEYDQPGTPLVRVKKYLGTASQTADADLISESGGKWTSAHRLRGICYLYVRLQYDDDVFGSIGIPNISAVLRGKKVRDPRAGVTAWSENSALCLADYLLDNPYGLGCAAAEVPDAEVSAAADICDQLVTKPSGGTEKRYTCNGALSSADTALQNKEALEQSMAGTAVWTQGRWLILPGAAQPVDMALDADDVADGSSIKIVPSLARQSLRNRVVATYVEPAQQWAEMQAPPATRSGYVAADGGFDIPEEVTLRMVTGSERAQRLSFVKLDRARQATVVEAPFKLQAYNTVPGHWVTLSLARYGWSAKTFEVLSRSLDFTKMQVLLRLQEVADVYTPDPADLGVVDLTPNTSLPAGVPNALAGLSVASGTAHLLLGSDGGIITRGYVTWAQSDNAFVTSGGRIELETMFADGNAITDWSRHAPVDGASTSAYVAPLLDQRLTLLRARPVTNRGKTGPWAYVLFMPVGKSAAPANVSGASYTAYSGGAVIKWARPSDLDYGRTEWRLGASYAAGTRVYSGDSTEFVWAGLAVGTYQLWGAHYDTTGNVSATPAGLSVTITDAGTSAIGVVLSNETHVFPASAAGAVSSYVGSGTTIRVYEGATELAYDGTGTANGSWTVSSSATNITRGAITDSGTYATVGDHSGVASGTDTSSIVYTITGKTAGGASFSITKTQTFSKAKAGAAGADGADGTNGANATAYWLARSVAAVQKSLSGVYTPASVTFSSFSATGTAAPAAYAGRFVIATSTDGSAYTTQYTSAANESSTTYTVPAGIKTMRVRLYLAGGTTTLLDEEVVPVVSDGATGATGAAGASAVVGILSNEAHVFPANAAGAVSSYVGSGTTIRVYEGAAELAYDGVGTASGSWTVSSAATNITRGTITDSGTYATVGDHSGVASGTDTSSIVYTITGKTAGGASFSITKTQTFSKAKAGAAGADGADGAAGANATAYWLARSVAAVQVGLSGVFTPASVTFSAFSATGTGAPAAYAGRFIISTSPDGSTYTTQYTSVANESSTAFTVPVGAKTIRVRLYLAGGTSTLLDEEVVPVVSDGALSPFQPVLWWEFNSTADGWTAGGASITTGTSSITLSSSGTDPVLVSPSKSFAGQLYKKVRVRLRRLAGSGWQGDLFYATAGHAFSASYYERVGVDPTIGGAWAIVEWDMSSLTVGGTDWATNTITQIRIDLGTTAADQFEIDWVAIGSESAGVIDGSIGTDQIEQSAVTELLTATVAGPVSIGTNGAPVPGGGTLINSISYTATADCDVEVVCNGIWTWAAPGQPTYLGPRRGYINGPGAFPNRIVDINTPMTADGSGGGRATTNDTFVKSFSMTAGSSATFEHRDNVYTFSPPSGLTLNVTGHSITLRVRKR